VSASCRPGSVADDAGQAIADHHQSRIGIGEGDLLVGRCIDGRFQGLQLLHLRFQLDQSIAQTLAAGFYPHAFLAIRSVERRQIARNRFVEVSQARLHLAAREILVAGVHALELAAVDSRNRPRKQAKIAADDDELRAGRTDRRAIVAPEIGDGFEVRRKTPGQPYQLDIALGSASARRPVRRNGLLRSTAPACRGDESPAHIADWMPPSSAIARVIVPSAAARNSATAL
jgi:hypothetical protein